MRWLLPGAFVVLMGAAAWLIEPPLQMGVAVVAHDICSKTFTSQLNPDQVFADSLKPRQGLKDIAGAIHYVVDHAARKVNASLLGIVRAQAVFNPGLGCVEFTGAESPGLAQTAQQFANRSHPPATVTALAGPALVEPRTAQLRQALEDGFEEHEGAPPRRTKAIVVLHDGQIVAERYAGGYGIDTPIMGFSMTKSVLNALVGILVLQGRLQVQQPAPVAQWSQPTDPRHTITLEQLMRMSSGLALDEHGGIANASDRMLYLHRDTAAFARSARPVAAPGTRFAYSSASAQIVAGIVQAAVGGGTLDVLSFADRELLAPLGMTHVTLEVDAAGTLLGCNYMFASARDWAAFGLLYANDGVLAGRRLLPAGWNEFSTAPTLGTDYGAGFWTGRGNGDLADGMRSAGLPPDAFLASGNLGQRLLIVPSRKLVIVRLGDSTDPTNDWRGFLKLSRDVLAAVSVGGS